MRLVSLRLAVLLAGFAILLFLTAPSVKADEWNLETKITPDHQIEVPGVVLDANTTYRIALMDSPYERKVVRIYNADGSEMLTQFIAISAERLQPVDATTFDFIEVPAGHPVPVQKWFYPGRRIGLEFLYSSKDRDKFAAYWKQGQQTEQVAQVVEPPAVTQPEPQPEPQAPVQAQVEPPTQVQPVEPEPETPQIVQNTEPVQPAPTELPRTGSELDLFALVGALSTTLGLGLRMKRPRS